MSGDREGHRASRWIVAGVGVLVIAAAGTALSVEIGREPARHGPVASPSGRPGAPHAGTRPVPGPLKIQGRQVAEVVSDPPGALAMTSFSLPKDGNLFEVTAYVLDPATGTFVATPYVEAAVSPDGRTVAGIAGPYGASRQVVVRDRRTGAERHVSLPSSSGYLRWAPNGRRILVSLYSTAINEGLRGFAVIDPDTMRVQVTSVSGKGRPQRLQSEGEFAWDSTGQHVVAPGAGSRLLRFSAATGKPAPDVRLTKFYDAREILYSPSGRMLACDYLQDMRNEIVLWDIAGRAPREIGRLRYLTLLGWYDGNRLLARRTNDSDRVETVLIDLDGVVRQTLVRDSIPWPGPAAMGQYSTVPRS
ncbi:hypothetical protein AB0J52_11550 [Spirillospora sp. NPDC049652]